MRCFSSPGSLRRPMDSVGDDPKGPGFPIRKSADQRALAPPRGLSQRATSFIASQCQGIHQMPLLRLIRSRSQGPEIVSRETGTETARNPKPRSLPCSPPSLRRHTQHFFFAGRPNLKAAAAPGLAPRDPRGSRPAGRPHHLSTMSKNGSRKPRIGTPSPAGGADRDRTGNLLLAKQALSQLSYGPD